MWSGHRHQDRGAPGLTLAGGGFLGDRIESGHVERRRARAALVGLTVIWGSTFVVIQSGLDHLSPLVLVALRFSLAALVLGAIRPQSLDHLRQSLRTAWPLSASMFLGFALQTAGLKTTTPARSAFITALSVVMVPAVELLATRRAPGPRRLAAVALAGGGIALLFHPIGLEWGQGDTLTLLGAMTFAYYIVELSRVAPGHGASTLVMAQCLSIAAAAALAAPLLETARFEPHPVSFAVVAYLGIVGTVFTFILMTRGQAHVGATDAAVIYALEPVIAGGLSVALGREPLTLQLVVGGAAVVVAMLVSALAENEARPAG